MQPSYITGTGLHTTLGKGVADCVAALHRPHPHPQQLECKLTGEGAVIPYFLLHECPYPNIALRVNQVITDVINQALSEAHLTPSQQAAMGLFVGSSSFEIAEEEERFAAALAEDEAAFPLAECGMGNLAERLRQQWGFKGPDFTFNTACTSSANALWYAGKLIDEGLIDHALVMTVEFANDTTAYGFQGLQLLSNTALRPFDDRRDGLILGESCAAVVLSRDPSSGGNGFALLGGANLCDTHSMSTTNEDGSAVAEVVSSALQDAGLKAEQIQAIKCHGTATLSGDIAEAKGIQQVFSSLPPCTVLKPFIGHTLGACGLSEQILFCAAAERGFLPGTPGLASRGENLGFTLNQEVTPLPSGPYMLNYFGFGGNNTSLIVSQSAG